MFHFISFDVFFVNLIFVFRLFSYFFSVFVFKSQNDDFRPLYCIYFQYHIKAHTNGNASRSKKCHECTICGKILTTKPGLEVIIKNAHKIEIPIHNMPILLLFLCVFSSYFYFYVIYKTR